MERIIDIRRSNLVDKVLYPGTTDKDRYARELRVLLRRMLIIHVGGTSVDLVWELFINGLLRTVSRELPIDTNRKMVTAALDALAELAPDDVQWRSELTERITDSNGEQI